MTTFAFDVYGTLIDPLTMESALVPLFCRNAAAASELWRQKQLEYSFRRAAMRRYQDFHVCTAQALEFTARRFGVELSEEDRRMLLEQYRRLPAYPDAREALGKIAADAHRIAAFSNGTEEAVRGLLGHAGLAHYFRDVISVDDVKSFKPDPAVYEYLGRRIGEPMDSIWMVSSNPFDVIGAKAAGLRAVWVRRNSAGVFDPWEISPDRVVGSLVEIVEG